METDEDEKSDETKAIFAGYKEFKKQLKIAFGSANEEREAEGQIMHLRQTGSVQEYATKFRGLVATLEWSDDVGTPIFREGLKPAVKWELRNSETKKLADFITEATKVDNDLWEYRTRNQGLGARVGHLGKASQKPNVTRQRQPYYGPMPMDLDSAQKKRGNIQSGKFKGKHRDRTAGKISDKEREKRFKDKLCLYCGKPGHIAKDCKAKKQINSAEKEPKTAKRTEPQEEMNMATPQEEKDLAIREEYEKELRQSVADKGKARNEETTSEEEGEILTFDGGKATYVAQTDEALYILTNYWERVPVGTYIAQKRTRTKCLDTHTSSTTKTEPRKSAGS
jgi:hypothetical protein